MNRAEIERQLRRLMVLRVVTVTTLLISAFGIELLLRPGETLRPLFLWTAVAYGMVLLCAALDRWLGGSVFFLQLQLGGDALLVTAFVGITGGLDSPMSFLYLLPIAVASLLLFPHGGLAMAGTCWLLYAALVLFGRLWFPLGLLAPSASPEPGRIGYSLVVHLAAFVTVARLASYLAERLRAQGDELAERRGALARLQALNENIIESINSGLITTDLNGRVNFMNRGGAEISGHSQSSVWGRSIEEMLCLGDGFLPETRKLLLDKRRFRFERWFSTGDGRRIFLGIAVSTLFDRLGQPLGFIFIFQDLTEIHAMEQELRLRDRMAVLGKMAARMAHELRNPLAAMSGAVQYLKGSLRPSGETLELMDIILRESERLEHAIRDFLQFARPGPFTPVACDLVHLLEEDVKLLNKSPELSGGHRVETRFGSPEILCEIDPNRMRQVFWNLATNAVKAMPQGGTLLVEAQELEGSEEVAVVFADEGVGMDEQEAATYFQPFRGSFHEGTGLGAAIVYRIVQEHRGRIHVESAPGKGTRIRMVFPRRAAHSEDAREWRHALGGVRS